MNFDHLRGQNCKILHLGETKTIFRLQVQVTENSTLLVITQTVNNFESPPGSPIYREYTV